MTSALEPLTWWCVTCDEFVDATTLHTLAAHMRRRAGWHTLDRDPCGLRQLPIAEVTT